MEDKLSKLWNFFDLARQIASALNGIADQMKRFNDLQEQKLRIDPQGGINKLLKKKARAAEALSRPTSKEKPLVLKTRKRIRTPKGRIPEILYNSIVEISREKPEFLAREVINHAMKSAPDIFQKQSLNTAFQGFKIGSKTSERQPAKCRNLIVPVEGQRGLYRVNPEKIPQLEAGRTSSEEKL